MTALCTVGALLLVTCMWDLLTCVLQMVGCIAEAHRVLTLFGSGKAGTVGRALGYTVTTVSTLHCDCLP